MKIIFTGGHFSPAYAVIKKLKDNHEIVVVGRSYAFEGDNNETFEYQMCKKNGIAFHNINAGRLQRKYTSHTLSAAAKFPIGIVQALKILHNLKPDIVVTFGGYIGLPVAIAAKLLGIPVVLHEQTQKAGLAARIIARFATVVLISFESSRKYFGKAHVIMTGNPIREELFQNNISNPFHSEAPIIYVTGGSTGAHAINILIKNALSQLVSDFHVIHQVGSQASDDYQVLLLEKKELPSKYQKNYTIEQFFSPLEVSYLLKNSLLVVSRSGINTVTELIATGAVALLIPLPYGQHDEQKDNAKFYSGLGLGEYVLQDSLTSSLLVQKMRDMIKVRQQYAANKEHALQYIHIDAADKIAELIVTYGRREKRDFNATQKA